MKIDPKDLEKGKSILSETQRQIIEEQNRINPIKNYKIRKAARDKMALEMANLIHDLTTCQSRLENEKRTNYELVDLVVRLRTKLAQLGVDTTKGDL
jgi:hypothetical protein